MRAEVTSELEYEVPIYTDVASFVGLARVNDGSLNFCVSAASLVGLEIAFVAIFVIIFLLMDVLVTSYLGALSPIKKYQLQYQRAFSLILVDAAR